MAQFDIGLSDNSSGAVYDFDAGHTTAIVAFGGLRMRMGGMPPFEFFGQLDNVPAARVFVRDIEQAWYQCGIQGVAGDIPGCAQWLRALLDDHGIERVVCVGCSAGGFAAILFGCRIGAAEVHAFGAQTSIARRDLRKAKDRRWDENLKAMRPKIRGRETTLDVLPVVAASAPGPNIVLHWGTREERDGRHAQRLAHLPNVEIVAHKGLGHSDLTRELRDRGELRALLLAALA